MLEQDRITVDKAMELIAETGYRLRQGLHAEKMTGECCAIGLPAVAQVGADRVNACVQNSQTDEINKNLAILTGLDLNYLDNLERGFENNERRADDEWGIKGYEDGVALKLAVARGTLPGTLRKHTLSSIERCVENVEYGVVFPVKEREMATA